MKEYIFNKSGGTIGYSYGENIFPRLRSYYVQINSTFIKNLYVESKINKPFEVNIGEHLR